MLDVAEAKVLHIAEQGSRGQQNYVEIGKLLASVVERIEDLYNRDDPSDVTGVATGFTDLDRMTAGLQPGDLVIVAGRPSMGKTALALNIGEHVALDSKMPVAVFSMEMGATQLAMRMIGSVGRLTRTAPAHRPPAADDWEKLSARAGPPERGADPHRRNARAHRDRGPLARAPHAQAVQGARPRSSSTTCSSCRRRRSGENRATEISEISRSMKALAKELKVPVVALSQLNRSLEQRPNKRPVMSDLRESGAIEQDADVILFIYRDEVYNPDTQDKGMAEIIIGKQRNGPIGTVRLTFLGEYTRFENFAQPGAY